MRMRFEAVRRWLAQVIYPDMQAAGVVEHCVLKQRSQEATILSLIQRDAARVSAAAELCRDFRVYDELGQSINSEETFIDFATRRAHVVNLEPRHATKTK